MNAVCIDDDVLSADSTDDLSSFSFLISRIRGVICQPAYSSSEFRVQRVYYSQGTGKPAGIALQAAPREYTTTVARDKTHAHAQHTKHKRHHPNAGLTLSNERAWLRARPPLEASAWAGSVPRRQASA